MVFYDYDGQWYPGMDGGLRFFDFAIWLKKNQEKPQPRKLSRPGKESGPARRLTTMLLIEDSGGQLHSCSGTQ